MELTTVTFDRIFDVVHTMRNRVPCTEFGFGAGALRQVAVAVPGQPEIGIGTTVTAVLKESGNWQTLLGWVNHQTGEIACIEPTAEAGSFVASLIGSVWAFALWRSHPIFALIVLAIAGCFLVGGIVGVRVAMRARALLVSVACTVRKATGTQSSNRPVQRTATPPADL